MRRSYDPDGIMGEIIAYLANKLFFTDELTALPNGIG